MKGPHVKQNAEGSCRLVYFQGRCLCISVALEQSRQRQRICLYSSMLNRRSSWSCLLSLALCAAKPKTTSKTSAAQDATRDDSFLIRQEHCHSLGLWHSEDTKLSLWLARFPLLERPTWELRGAMTAQPVNACASSALQCNSSHTNACSRPVSLFSFLTKFSTYYQESLHQSHQRT